MHRPVFHFKIVPVIDIRNALREAIRHIAANHALDDAILGNITSVDQRFDHRAIANDGDFIRDLLHLVQLMRNNDRCDALVPQTQKQLEQLFRFFIVQRGGRFIQNQQLYLFGQRLCDFHQLLFADAQRLHLYFGIYVKPNRFEQSFRFRMCARPIDNALRGQTFIAHEQIFRHGKLREQRKLLMDDYNAARFTVLNLFKFAKFTVKIDISGICAVAVYAAEHIHQRGFPRTVFADQRMNMMFLYLKVHIGQRLYAGKQLCDALHFQ